MARHKMCRGKARERHSVTALCWTALFALLISTGSVALAKADRTLIAKPIQTTPSATTESIGTEDEANRAFEQSLRMKALQNLQRSLESLSSLTANSLMLNAAFQSPEALNDDDTDGDAIDGEGAATAWETEMDENTIFVTTAHSTPSSDNIKRNGILRIRADLKEMPLATADDIGTAGGQSPNTATTTTTTTTDGVDHDGHEPSPPSSKRARHLRSAVGRHHQHSHHHHQQHGSHPRGAVSTGGGAARHGQDQVAQLHRRRRKGCPTVQGKDQLLCPTRNSQRYDVCITRDQLCDRLRDCPGGEDEDPRQCFFYRPLDHSLKTISHAVLLLVDTVMREQEEHQQQRNEL